MKTFQLNLGKLFMIAIACSFAAIATTQAGALRSTHARATDSTRGGNARLVVWRGADFGTLIYLNLFVDGVQVTTMGRNVGYEAILRPGQHVFSVGTTPNPCGHTKLEHRRVNVRAGETYAFTALWVWTDKATLETSASADHPSRAPWW